MAEKKAKRKSKAKPKKGKSSTKAKGKEVEKKKLNISDEERKRRSEAMKKRIEEGKAGAAFGRLGGRPKKKRASEVVAEEASKHGKEIAQVFLDAMDETNPNSIRIKGAEGILKVEEKEARLQMDEEEHFAKMGRDELAGELARMLSGNPVIMDTLSRAATMVQNGEVEPTIEGEAEEEEIQEAEVVDD